MFGKTITEKQVLKALSNVKDPDLDRDIVSLGFIKNLKIENGNVKFDLELTTPACPVKELLKNECESNLKKLPGIGDITINMTSRVRKGPNYKQENLNGVKNLLAVASGKGGVGKSTVAVNIAFALMKSGASVGLMDADIYGPSIPTMLGVTGKPHVEGNMIYPVEKSGIKLMSMGFLLGDDSPVIWRGPMVSGITQQFLGQVIWGELDYLVIDLPPGTGDVQLTLTQQAPLTGAVIVTTPQEVCALDARRGLKMFEQVNVPVLGIVENMSYFVCDGCSKKHYIFTKGGGLRISKEMNVPFLGSIPLESAIAIGGDNGNPIVMSDENSPASQAYMELTSKIAASLSIIKEGGTLKGMAPSPAEIDKVNDKEFEILWTDGHKSIYSFTSVRAGCQCAGCIDEWTGNTLLDKNSIPDNIYYKNVEKVGSYALSFDWSDGHNTGIYSYELLRKLCECKECKKPASCNAPTQKHQCESSACAC